MIKIPFKSSVLYLEASLSDAFIRIYAFILKEMMLKSWLRVCFLEILPFKRQHSPLEIPTKSQISS